MPTYVYRCLECDDKFEVRQAFTDDALTVCNCEKAAPVRKVFTAVGVTFKGSGFYKNDSRGSSSKSGNAASSTNGGASTASSEKTDSSTTSSGESSGAAAAPTPAPSSASSSDAS